MTDSFEIERAKKLVTIGQTIKVISLFIEVLIIVLYHLGIFTSQEDMLLSLALIPWFKYIFALIHPEVVAWDEDEHGNSIESKKIWRETHMRFWEGWHLIVQMGVMLYLMRTLSIVAQTSKGFKTIVLICGIAFIIMMLIGFAHIKGDSKVSQMIHFGMVMVLIIGCTVVTGCYCFSTLEKHEECTYVSRSTSEYTRNHPFTDYYVTVMLNDGTKYKCLVAPSLYKNARDMNLVVCRRKGPLGIEYMRVHGSQELT